MKALVIIDMQVDLCRDIRRVHSVESMLDPLVNLIHAFRDANQCVIFVKFELDEDDEQFARFGDKYCIKGTPGAEIIPELQALVEQVVIKKKHSAFFETNLHAILQELKVDEIYLAGLQTQICIMTTAADASFRGYRTIVLRDCVVSTREDVKVDALNWIEKYVGSLMNAADVMQVVAH